MTVLVMWLMGLAWEWNSGTIRLVFIKWVGVILVIDLKTRLKVRMLLNPQRMAMSVMLYSDLRIISIAFPTLTLLRYSVKLTPVSFLNTLEQWQTS